ncbi:3-isopropylmalate dehydratase small subunit [Burkholderia pseudomultivorans]|uniref:3-isopropylmalate dehydratase small subunit n=1 Tax=Burkholderia pseudomultivorans TaxID=1207504 RepID=UPI0007554944|nr:3-isopropylmalate dehydratase small subunit [Burkholderia pseudomultivorans]KWF06432.1 3-isopropylmalate dehydratase [Burkholderia pseudomultivorans]
MKPFERHVGKPVSLDRDNIDTDAIIPKQFMKSISRVGLGQHAFDAWRYRDEGYFGKPIADREPEPDFILNNPDYASPTILVTGENFGCGSSREHAPWALQEFGFKVLIARSFADIFYGNCCKIGLLPIVLGELDIKELHALIAWDSGLTLEVDLIERWVKVSSGKLCHFSIDEVVRQDFVNGMDDVSATLSHADEIRQFEARHIALRRWI